MEEELPCSSLNHLQQLPKNSFTFGTSVHSTNFSSHLGNTPVTSHHTLEMPHMEHLEKSWHYINMMQVFSHFLKRNANECFAELESGSNGATWAKRKPPIWNTKMLFALQQTAPSGWPAISLTYNPCTVSHSDISLSPHVWVLYKSHGLLLETMPKTWITDPFSLQPKQLPRHTSAYPFITTTSFSWP